MKWIHTADWHLGKLVHGIHMTEDQEELLEQFVALVEEEKPDAVIIAGDLYDRSVPPVEAVDLLDRTFTRLVMERKTPVLAIAGNHDSPDRVGFVSRLLKNRGLYLAGKITLPLEPVVLEDEYGPVNFFLLPYAEPAVIRELLEREDVQTHNDAMGAMIDHIKERLNPRERNVLVAHAFVTGGEESESERPLSVGGSGQVDASHFEPFHYTALGHLHRPQRIKRDRIRYAGSLMKYSFSEAEHEKSVSIVHMDREGEVTLETRVLKPKRDMRIVEGYLNDLLHSDEEKSEDYLMVSLLDEGQIIDPIGKLRSVFPNVLRLERKAWQQKTGSGNGLGKEQRKLGTLELFDEFYRHVKGSGLSAEKKDVLQAVLQEMEREEREM